MARWAICSHIARIVAVAVLVAGSGCATRGGRFASQFVKEGEPSVTFDDPTAPAPVPAPPLSDYLKKVRALQSKAVPKNSLQPTLESSSPDLTRVLLLLATSDSAEHHRLAALTYRKAGILDYAFRHYQRAAAMEPCDAVSYDGMARLWRDWAMPDLALSEVYRALHCQPQSAEIYNTLGTILESLGQPGSAHRAYERAVTLDPGAAFALNNLCYLELDAGHGAAAGRLCERALAVAPDFAAARNNLALVQARFGDLGAAEQRLRTGTLTASSLYNIGILRLHEGRYSEAALVFDQAAAAQPSLTIARRRSVQARKAARVAEQAR